MENLKPGIEKEAKFVVTEKDTASVYGSGLLAVYATPAMIAFMENTAPTSIAEYLPKELTTVGIEINVKHLKASAVGTTLYCCSRLTNVEGKRLTFEIQVKDKEDIVGEAYHVRYVVDMEKFMDKVSQFNK